MYNILVFFFYQDGHMDGNYTFPFYKRKMFIRKLASKTQKP